MCENTELMGNRFDPKHGIDAETDSEVKKTHLCKYLIKQNFEYDNKD